MTDTTEIARRFILRRKYGQWYICRFDEKHPDGHWYGPYSWAESDEQTRILIQAGYMKEAA